MEAATGGRKRIWTKVVITLAMIIWVVSLFGPFILVVFGSSPHHPVATLLLLILATIATAAGFLLILRLVGKGLTRPLGKFTRRALVYVLLALMVMLFIMSYPNVLPHWISGICMIFAEIILAILILWAACSFPTLGSYITDRYPEEFDRLAETFNRTASETIAKMLGKEAYLKLYPGELHPANVEEYFQECAKRSPVKGEAELRFYMLAKKANLEALKENFRQAQESLREALAIEPQTFILWLRLAEVSERLGAGPEAIAAYERALVLAPEHPEVKDFLRAQIRFVRTRGPRKQLPIQGTNWLY